MNGVSGKPPAAAQRRERLLRSAIGRIVIAPLAVAIPFAAVLQAKSVSARRPFGQAA